MPGIDHTTVSIAITAAAGGVVLMVLLMRLLARPRTTVCHLEPSDTNRRLVVLVHGLLGRSRFTSAIDLARSALPGSDLLVVDYKTGVLANTSPYAIANAIERRIHDAFTKNGYDEIVLVGHSMGGTLLRKAIVWASGLEEDREAFGRRGTRKWIAKTTRFVSLATINRGWSIEPRPEHMDLPTFCAIWIGQRIARLTRTGQLGLAMRRGSPFVADARVQWIALCRRHEPQDRNVPQTIHLLGDRDDIVSKDDSMDLIAAKDTVFITVQDTGHREIGTALSGGQGKADRERRERVRLALQGRLDELEPDAIDTFREDLTIERVVYVMHGIRDYGEWTDRLREVIEQQARSSNVKLAVVNQKYGHFPMLPFLLHGDRQKNVRLFMDEYTENRARFPRAEIFDYVGHSNGTYILASALQHYKTLTVGNVFFAGSVVPKHYEWLPLVERKRVHHVANVVGADDWVVALFPRLFEQIAEWRNIRPKRGPLDIGSAGFRGFEDARDAQKRIENVQFASGPHSAGVDAANEQKLSAIARYIVTNDMSGFSVFRNETGPNERLAFWSNVCWLVWIGIAVVLIAVGLGALYVSPWAGVAYALVLLGLLNSL